MLMQILADLPVEVVDGEKGIPPGPRRARRDGVVAKPSNPRERGKAGRGDDGAAVGLVFVGPEGEGGLKSIMTPQLACPVLPPHFFTSFEELISVQASLHPRRSFLL